jgi:hypothetical protein
MTSQSSLTRDRLVGLIFSRDRALQLEAVLGSLSRNCQDPAFLDCLHILFAASSQRFARQYRELAERGPWPFGVAFHEETAFRRDVLSILGLRDRRRRWMRVAPRRLSDRTERAALRRPLDGPSWSHILFLVDDNIFVRPFSLAECISTLLERPRAAGFSLRLGRNTVYCHPHAASQCLPPFTTVAPGVLVFPWPGADHDFGYPIEVSSSIYSADTIARPLAALDYSNPNTLEAVLARSVRTLRLSVRQPELCCLETSVTFCNAVNRVQDTIANRAGESVNLPAEQLATLFDQGAHIDTDMLAGFVPSGCHCEVPFSLA